MKMRLLAVSLVIMMLAVIPAQADPADSLWPLGKMLNKVEKITVKQAAKEAISYFVSINPENFTKWVKNTFTATKNPPIPIPGYKVFKAEIISTPAIAEAYGARPIFYVATNKEDTSDRKYGILIFPGEEGEHFLGWYDI